MTTVGEIMTREVHSLGVDQTLYSAMQFMREHHVRHIPVISEEGQLLGIVTDRDIKRATPSALDPGQREVWEQIVTKTTLAKVMTSDPITASVNTDFKHALKLFVEEKIGCLPVMGDGKLIGIVTASDLFRGMLAVLEG